MNKFGIIILVVSVLAIVVAVGCVAANSASTPVVSDDTRAQVLSIQDYATPPGYLPNNVMVLHYEKYHVTCFVSRVGNSGSGISCLGDNVVTGV
jgi:hypothetical protein